MLYKREGDLGTKVPTRRIPFSLGGREVLRYTLARVVRPQTGSFDLDRDGRGAGGATLPVAIHSSQVRSEGGSVEVPGFPRRSYPTMAGGRARFLIAVICAAFALSSGRATAAETSGARFLRGDPNRDRQVSL